MRTDKFLAFNGGKEFNVESSIIGDNTGRPDPSNNLTLAFAPVRQARLEEMLSMATQLGVAKLQPVITERVNEHHIKWDRIRKIIIEAAEQSGRNSIPELMEPKTFDKFIKESKNLVFADERFAHNTPSKHELAGVKPEYGNIVLIGPEGGFSSVEFAALDAAGAIGIGLSKTILRAETAAVAAITKLANFES